jgi:hypothetical protein
MNVSFKKNYACFNLAAPSVEGSQLILKYCFDFLKIAGGTQQQQHKLGSCQVGLGLSFSSDIVKSAIEEQTPPRLCILILPTPGPGQMHIAQSSSVISVHT